jgi:hypothetical protein
MRLRGVMLNSAQHFYFCELGLFFGFIFITEKLEHKKK